MWNWRSRSGQMRVHGNSQSSSSGSSEQIVNTQPAGSEVSNLATAFGLDSKLYNVMFSLWKKRNRIPKMWTIIHPWEGRLSGAYSLFVLALSARQCFLPRKIMLCYERKELNFSPCFLTSSRLLKQVYRLNWTGTDVRKSSWVDTCWRIDNGNE